MLLLDVSVVAFKHFFYEESENKCIYAFMQTNIVVDAGRLLLIEF